MLDENGLSIEEILELPGMEDVKEELEDPRFASRTHGSRATYALKCHGPLCGKSERDRARRRNRSLAEKEGREYRASSSRKFDRDDLLTAITIWHKREVALRRVIVDGEPA